jgi:dTMP kinase
VSPASSEMPSETSGETSDVVRGRFIVFEGGEACGKSTQSRLLADALDAVATREPGGTPIGARLRELLLDPATVDLEPRAEALLMAADRAQHLGEVVRPALEAGRHVVADRSAFSSMAYQGYGRGLPLDEVRHLSDWAAEGVWPDLVVLLEVPVAVAAERLGSSLDRMERLGDDFHRRVAGGFRTMAVADPQRWVVLDGGRSVDEVAAAVRAVVRERLQLLG